VSLETWTAVDEFAGAHLAPADDVLESAIRASEQAGLPAIQVSPLQGKLLYLLARMRGARKILEFGTLGGYSAIWLARALPADGQLISLEAAPAYADVARENISAAGLADKVDLRVGAALETLPDLEAEGAGPFDLTFIDADKANTPEYFSWSVEHSRPGAVIVADNVIRDGSLADEGSDDPKVQAQRRLHREIAADPRVTATTIQTVGRKGYDGFTIALVGDRARPAP
jgi:predicted O-methyltransferase YrrM